MRTQAVMLRPSRPSISRGGNTNIDEESALRQNGRSSTGLAAQAAGAALRNFARGRSPVSNRPSMTSSVSSTSRDSFKSVQKGGLGATDTTFNAPSGREHTPDSPLDSTSSDSTETSESGGNSSGSGSSKQQVPSSRESRRDGNPEAPRRPILRPPRGPPGPLENPDTGQKRSKPVPPFQTSMLGRDSRYLSRRSSSSTPSTPAPQCTRGGGPAAVRWPFLALSAKVVHVDEVTIGCTMDPEKQSTWLPDDLVGSLSKPDASNKFPLYIGEKEIDDDMHMPQPDDDVRLKATFKEIFAVNRLCSLFGLLFMLVGPLSVFILLPVLSHTGTAIYSYPYDPPPKNTTHVIDPSAHVDDVKYPLLQNIRTGLIDPDTPKSAMTRQSFSGEELVLVFSDEFNKPNRSFCPGDDAFWTGQDLWYGKCTSRDHDLSIRLFAAPATCFLARTLL